MKFLGLIFAIIFALLGLASAGGPSVGFTTEPPSPPPSTEVTLPETTTKMAY